MSQVFEIIFDMFGQVIIWLKMIPVVDGVSLFDFLLAVLILTITIVAFVPLVAVGGTVGTGYELYREPRKIGFGSDNSDNKWHLRRKK